MEEIERRLTSACTTSNNAQQLCAQYHDKAKQIMQKCKEQGKKLIQAETSLHSLQAVFIDQLDILMVIFTKTQRNFSALEVQLTAHTSRQKKIYTNLAETFRKLKNQKMDSGLTPTKEAQTLFNYVDNDTVHSLQRELDSVLGILLVSKKSLFTSLILLTFFFIVVAKEK